MQYRGAIMTHKEKGWHNLFINGLLSKGQCNTPIQVIHHLWVLPQPWWICYPSSHPNIDVSKKATDVSESSVCHVGYPEASSYSALVKVMLAWHMKESWSMCLYVSIRTRALFLCLCVRFQPCLILFAFKLSFMLFGGCFATSREITYFHICASLMFSCCLFASNGILIKAQIFHVHQSLLQQFDEGWAAVCPGNSWFICNE